MSARRMPAEWEPQEGVLLCFPHTGRDWPGKWGAVVWAFVEFIRIAAQRQRVFLVVADAAHRDRVTAMLERAHADLGQITFIEQRTNRSWMRDSGPIVVEGAEGREALHFGFSGWAKYPNHRLDRLLPPAVAAALDLPVRPVVRGGRPVVLEGGSIDVNGRGTLLTTEECLLDPTIQIRNPGFTRADYESVFAEELGVTSTVWLGNGIAGDDTHGHIDDIARFVSPTAVLAAVEPDPRDVNHAPLADNLRRLRAARLADGRPLDIIELPMPHRIDFEGLRLPASYANFLIINGAVLVPTFNDPRDRTALGILAECFPDREIIGIGATDLIWGFGTLHCLSQQVPAVSQKP
jgi:agmatine deiminase